MAVGKTSQFVYHRSCNKLGVLGLRFVYNGWNGGEGKGRKTGEGRGEEGREPLLRLYCVNHVTLFHIFRYFFFLGYFL